MDRAAELVRGGVTHGAVVVADHQTAGRGRRGRSWGLGPPGSQLLVTWCLRLDAERAALLSVLSAVPLLRAARALAAPDLSIKWPNDLLLGTRKVAGTLATGVTDAAGEPWMLLGTGIDVHTRDHPVEVRDDVTSFAASGVVLDRLALLSRLAPELERLVDGGEDEIRLALEEWRRESALLGRRVRVEDGKAAFDGEAVDLDEEGALLVRRPDGAIARVLAADVSVRMA